MAGSDVLQQGNTNEAPSDAACTSMSGAPAGDGLSAIVLDLDNRNLARTLAGAMQNLIEPPPDALSVFETAAGSGLWRVTAYYADPPDCAGLGQSLEAITGESIPAPKLESVPDLNWVALSQAALPPVQAGRFTVHGAHDRHRVPQGPNALLVEAGEAFGTAHHATTYGCLLEIDRLTRRGRFQSVLDLGCGSGILAIAVARADPGARILASDIDPGSVAVAAENAAVNRCAGRIRTLHAAGLGHPEIRQAGRYDLLIANILAGPLIVMAKDLARAVKPGGMLVLSGLLDDQAREIIATYNAAGFSLLRRTSVAGWSTLAMTRRVARAQIM